MHWHKTLWSNIKTKFNPFSSWSKTVWENLKTKLNAANLNNIELGIGELFERVLPVGGTSGQSLIKTNSENYKTEWKTITGITAEQAEKVSGMPTGGTTGQSLVKASNTAYNTKWETVSGSVPGGGSAGQALVRKGTTETEWKSLMTVYSCVNAGITGGNTNQSTAVQSWLNEISTAGGGIAAFVHSGTKPYFRFQNVAIPSNVWLWQEPGVSFKYPESGIAAHPTIIEYSAGFESGTYIENFGSIGKLTFDLSEAKKEGENLTRAIEFLGAKNGYFDWIDIIPSEAIIGAIVYSQNEHEPGSETVGSHLTPTNININKITYNTNGTVETGKVGGGGAVQIGGAKDCWIGTVKGKGGIGVRFETDALGEHSKTWEEIDGFKVDYISNEEGYAGAGFAPHLHTVKNIDIGNITTRACACWAYTAPEEFESRKSTFGPVHIGSGFCMGGKNSKGVEEVTGKTGEGFSEKQEGLYGISGTMPLYTSTFKVDHLTVSGVSGSGAWGFHGLHIGNLSAVECEEYGVRDVNASETVTSTRARIDKLKIKNCCGGLAEFSRNGMLSGYMEHWSIGLAEITDSRGGSAKMERAIDTWKKTNLVVEDLITSGMTAEPYRAQEESVIFANGYNRKKITAHGWAPSGETKEETLSGFFVEKYPYGTTATEEQKIVGVMFKIAEGTSAKFEVYRNGGAIEWEGSTKVLEAKPTAAKKAPKSTLLLTDEDYLNIKITSVTGTPKLLAVTLFIEHY